MRGAAAALVAACALLIPHASGQEKPLPERETFLREAREALSRSQQLWHQFSYKERRTDVHVNPFGRMGTGATRVLQVTPSPQPRLTYRKVIERNGVAVSRKELEQQDADYRARVAAARTAAASADGPRAREDAERQARSRAQRVIDDVLGMMEVAILRREYRAGEPFLVVSFAARPDAKPVTRHGRVAKAFAGTAWVHEPSREVIRIEALARDDVSFGGFLAKMYKGTRAAAEREQIEPGVWMPTRVKLTGDIRALFRKARVEYLMEWFDYRRLPAVTGPAAP